MTLYNRYTPKQDGTYRRDRIPEQEEASQDPRPAVDAPSVISPPEEIPVAAPIDTHREPETKPVSPFRFLGDLLPRQMDTGDLLTLLILLLLLSEGKEDSGSPLLTLALFFLLE